MKSDLVDSDWHEDYFLPSHQNRACRSSGENYGLMKNSKQDWGHQWDKKLLPAEQTSFDNFSTLSGCQCWRCIQDADLNQDPADSSSQREWGRMTWKSCLTEERNSTEGKRKSLSSYRDKLRVFVSNSRKRWSVPSGLQRRTRGPCRRSSDKQERSEGQEESSSTREWRKQVGLWVFWNGIKLRNVALFYLDVKCFLFFTLYPVYQLYSQHLFFTGESRE